MEHDVARILTNGEILSMARGTAIAITTKNIDLSEN